MKEIYKDIPGFEGLYEASNFGNYRVKKYQSGGKKANTILKPKTMKDGYLMFRLSKNGIQYHKNAHRIIATLFLKPPKDKNKIQINHKNGIKHDNSVCNLEWVTPKENIKHSLYILGNITKITNRNRIGICSTKEGKKEYMKLYNKTYYLKNKHK